MASIGPLCQYGTAIVSTSVPKRHVDEWTVPPSPSRVPASMANAYNGGSASGPDKYQPTASNVCGQRGTVLDRAADAQILEVEAQSKLRVVQALSLIHI